MREESSEQGEHQAAAATPPPPQTMLETDTGRRRQKRRCPSSWTLLNPTVLWSIVILAIAPTLHGFGGLVSLSSSPSTTNDPYWGTSKGGVAAAQVAETTSGRGGKSGGRRHGVAKVGAQAGAFTAAAGTATKAGPSSPSSAASWFKERVRDGKRRIHMQVMSMVPETQMDAKRFENAPVPPQERIFQINGWRWHARAVLRDVARFRRVALLAAEAAAGVEAGGEEGAAAVERVAKCYGFMWSFSFTKLHKTETELFFPWLRKLFPREVLGPLDEFDREREAVTRVGNKIGQFVAEAQRASASKMSPRAALQRCADLSEELEAKAARLTKAQEMVIVPLTAAYITSKDQWKFNDKVIFSLGLVNAQVFLVSMHDAIKADKEEFKTFRSQVPKFARALIPTWRRVLYSPRAGCLDESADVVAVK